MFYFAANVVLQGACERVIVGELYCDVPLGLYVIRGENVVLIGELVIISLCTTKGPWSNPFPHIHAIHLVLD